MSTMPWTLIKARWQYEDDRKNSWQQDREFYGSIYIFKDSDWFIYFVDRWRWTDEMEDDDWERYDELDFDMRDVSVQTYYTKLNKPMHVINCNNSI